jgi:hypothetical protein
MERCRRSQLLFVCAVLLVPAFASSQVIEFESGGLKYQALTKDGLTVMVAPLPANVRSYTLYKSRFRTVGALRGSFVPRTSSSTRTQEWK